MNLLVSLTSAQLIKAANIKERIARLEKELSKLTGTYPIVKISTPKTPAKKRKMSAAGRARIIAGQKARWAKIKVLKSGGKPVPVARPAPKKKFTMSAAARAKIATAAKARWAAKKTTKA
jgi:hypothetical protein